MSGIYKLVRFKLWAKLKAGDVEVEGLTRRRKAEAKLFLSQYKNVKKKLTEMCAFFVSGVSQCYPLRIH